MIEKQNKKPKQINKNKSLILIETFDSQHF